jgi:hypothetical protein
MLMSVPEVQRKCVAGVRTTAHGPDQNNAEPVEHVGSREQIGPGLSQPGTAARDPIKTMSAPASPSSRQLIRPRAQAARRDCAYRISHDDARIHMIADMLACPKSAIERNRSRGRALRHGRASNGWNDESVLPDDDEGPEACPQNR